MKTFITALIILSNLCFMYSWSIAQNNVLIRGRIKNQKGELIQGATVVVDGDHSKQILSDKDGKFNIFHDKAYSLLVTHIAYEPQNVDIGNSDNKILEIILKTKTMLLDEVVFSTGYERVPRERATGSFERIDSAYINRSPSTNIISRIKNIVSGIYFDPLSANFNTIGKPTNEKLNMHGISSISGSNSPLIILDNFPFTGDINNINPNDVEDITVLKDAAASSIWGAQAGNGVIVITTKKGKLDKLLKIEFNQNLSITAKPNLFTNNLIANSDLVNIQIDLYNKGFYNSNINSRTHPVLPMVVEILEKNKNKVLSDQQTDELLEHYRNSDIRDDMLKYLYRNALSQQYSLAFSGGTSKSSYRISTGFDHSSTIQTLDHNKRYTLKANNKLLILPRLDFDTEIQWSRLVNQGNNLIEYYTNNGHSQPYLTLKDSEGENVSFPYQYSLGYLEKQSDPRLLNWIYKPLEEMQNNRSKSVSNNLLLSTGIQYKINDLLQVTGKYRAEFGNSSQEQLYDPRSFKSRNLVNLYSQVEKDGSFKRILPVGGSLESNFNDFLDQKIRMQVSFNMHKNLRHQINALIGVEASERRTTSKSDILYGYDHEKLTYVAQIDYQNRYPTYDNLANNAFIPNNFGRNSYNNRFLSLFGNGSYTFDKKYIVSASVRKDASNIFGMDANDKWNPLWSLGASWLLSKESYFDMGWINNLKLRSTIGYSGNIDPSKSGNTTLTYNDINSIYGITWPSAQILVAPNPLLRWEKIRTVNVGLDISVFNNRINANVDLYSKKSFDLIHLYPLDPTVGLLSQAMNVADASSNGLDIKFSSLNIDRFLKWRSDLVFSYNNNKITKTFIEYPGPSTFVSSSLIAYQGAMAHGLYSYRFAGLEPATGMPMGYVNGESSTNYTQIQGKQTMVEDLKLHGSARALVYGTLNNILTYRNIELSFSLGYKFGYYFRRPTINYSELFNKGYSHTDFYKRWQKIGDEVFTNIPAMTYPINQGDGFYKYSDVLVEKGDHIRLNDIRLQYSFQNLNIREIQGLRIYAFVNNLGIIWRINKYGLDPDSPGNIPLPTQFSFGVNLTI